MQNKLLKVTIWAYERQKTFLYNFFYLLIIDNSCIITNYITVSVVYGIVSIYDGDGSHHTEERDIMERWRAIFVYY